MCLQLPCVVCKHHGIAEDSPGEYHHTNGKTAPGAHYDGFVLCARHHRIPDTVKPKRWVSRHGDGKALFEARYRPETEFIELQIRDVEAFKSCQV